jgi:hypothetical protein
MSGKNRKMHIFLVIMVSMSMLLTFGGPISAKNIAPPQTSEEANLVVSGIVKPMFMYISRTATSISIGTYGETTATGSVFGYPGLTDEIWIYLYLERYVNGNWETFGTWSRTFYTYYGTLQGTDVVPHGYNYRVRGSYYAWSGDSYEHVNGYSSVVYY